MREPEISFDWKEHWNKRSEQAASDFEFDRGVAPREKEIEELSRRELLDFINPEPTDVIFDAGCGTGVNILLLHSKVKRIVGMDYSKGALERCHGRLQSNNIQNAEVTEGSITQIPLPDSSIDKAICMSVLQYMNDEELRRAFREFARILRNNGTLVLHVKNLSSLYLSTLWIGKQLKSILGKPSKRGYYRTYGWYAKALASFGFEVVDYNSFELLTLPKMPTSVLGYLQKVELRNYMRPPLCLGWVRRHGSELKLKARLRKKRNR
jgi:ubiquinone/menaquinone biosynthesis C-methylase UbiE